MKQERGEKIGSYVSRLREKANDCEFGKTMEERILEKCIQSVDNKELIRKAISKGWELDKFIEEAAQIFRWKRWKLKNMVQYIKYKTTQIGDNIIDRDLHWEEIYNYQTLHVAIVDSIMKEEDAQRMGKTVDRVGKRTILRQGVEQDTNRMINKIKEVWFRGEIEGMWEKLLKTTSLKILINMIAVMKMIILKGR